MREATRDQPNRPSLSRRQLLRSAAAAGGTLALSSWLPALAEASGFGAARARSVVLVWLSGGPSHLDTFDVKDGPASGATKAIDTRIPGVRFASQLGRLAERMDKLALVRSMTHASADHRRGTYYAHTGYQPVFSIAHPSLGAVLAHERPAEDGSMPAFVAVGPGAPGAGFLGTAAMPFPILDPLRPGPYLKPAIRIYDERSVRRSALLASLNASAARDRPGTRLEEHRDLSARAHEVSRGPFGSALDLSAEPTAGRSRYGRDEPGTSCLLARRLVEAGVRCVEVTLNGWDVHAGFERTGELAAVLDRALSALVDDLSERGLLASTLLVCMGEFGRSPTINAAGGRGHHPAAYSALLGGGGIRPGTVVGRTDDLGARVVERPVGVTDLLATLFTLAGVDPGTRYSSPAGRPIEIAPAGKVVSELLG